MGTRLVTEKHPFSSRSVSDRYPMRLASELNARPQLEGRNAAIYKCAVRRENHQVAQCFTISAGEVRQLSGIRRLSC